MQVVVRVLLTLILLIAAGLLSYDLASYYLYSPWTRDARVRANVVTVAPDVSGYVDDIRVRNNQFVHKDDVLFVIDQDRYKLALANAEASGRVDTLSASHAARSIPAALEAGTRVHHHCRELSTTRAGSRKQRPPTTSRPLLRATPLL